MSGSGTTYTHTEVSLKRLCMRDAVEKTEGRLDAGRFATASVARRTPEISGGDERSRPLVRGRAKVSDRAAQSGARIGADA